MKDKDLATELRTLGNLMKRHLDNALSKLELENITGVQMIIIGFLLNNEGDVFQKNIEKKLEIRRSTVTNILNGMEKQGLIMRQTVDNDARLKKIVLTDKAIAIADSLEEESKKTEELLRNAITEEELEVFFSVMKKMKENMGGK